MLSRLLPELHNKGSQEKGKDKINSAASSLALSWGISLAYKGGGCPHLQTNALSTF